MNEKISLEQFRQLRSQLSILIDEIDEKSTSSMENDEYEKEFKRIFNQLFELQKQLLSYDLSDIPFEEWNEYIIISDKDHIADFSKSRANLDFGIVDFEGHGNFRGCNVKNLDKLHSALNIECFDEQTIQANPSLFLSDIFSEELKYKYYNNKLTVEDLSVLTKGQIDELSQKDFTAHLDSDNLMGIAGLFRFVDLSKAIELYNYSKNEFESLVKLFRLGSIIVELEESDSIKEIIAKTNVTEVKKVCFNYARNHILEHRSGFYISDYPQQFIDENPDLFLINVDIPEDVKKRYFERKLKVKDLIDYPDAFMSFPIDKFLEIHERIQLNICDHYGIGKFQELVKRHPDVFEHLIEENDLWDFQMLFSEGKDLESVFITSVKKYFIDKPRPDNFAVVDANGQIIYNVPSWLKSMNFTFVEKLETKEDLLNYNDFICVLDRYQDKVLETLNIENIKRFEQETGFFSHKANDYSIGLEMFDVIRSFYMMRNGTELLQAGIDFKNGGLSYEEFLPQFAKFLDYMRRHNIFTDYPNYNWIQGSFREKFPEIFIDSKAPEDLIKAFFWNNITPDFLYKHKDYITYLINYNLGNIISADIKLTIPSEVSEYGYELETVNFIDIYAAKYGNEKLLQLLSKYGGVLSDITISSWIGDIADEKAIEKDIIDAIYNRIIKSKMDYSYLVDTPELTSEHPDLFVNFDSLTSISTEERQRLTKAFYSRSLRFEDIFQHPELITILKDKNLQVAFQSLYDYYPRLTIGLNNDIVVGEKKVGDLDLLKIISQEEFLILCSKYGRYLQGVAKVLNNEINFEQYNLSFEELTKKVEEIIAFNCINGEIAYHTYDAPEFLVKSHPELFLDEGAPKDLVNYFYNYGNNYPMTFAVLQKNKQWLPFLKGKNIIASLMRSYLKSDLIKYFQVFGEETGLKLGINRGETVYEMLKSHQVELMKEWYDRTGGKFIPDFVVMQNFSLEEADKFLASGSNWSTLMRIQNFAATPDARDAMLKIAYCFGAFDQDQRGFKKVIDLLTSFPRKINAEDGHIIEQIDNQIDIYSQRGVFYHNAAVINEDGSTSIETPDMTPEEKEAAYNQMIEHAKKSNFFDLFDTATLVNLLETLKKEKVDIDFAKPIFSQIYRKNEDGSYSLRINSQSYPKSSQIIRSILENFGNLPMLNPVMAHRYFGGFKLDYDPDFREFFLTNFETIISDAKYLSRISTIQRRFKEIKAVYSNVTLTLDLAMSFTTINKYDNVQTGNQLVSSVAALQDYTQQDFETLQMIFNYGKQRTFSSIPRIESKQGVVLPSGMYYYEMLRLDDPRAMSIGFESDCCQQLGHAAEHCMEHSMVDQNGRVFIITNEKNEVVAQSWVWRNKDVLCFDNIEIPDQKMWDNGVPKGMEDSGIRNQFTDDILTIYKAAAHELIQRDTIVYRELLDSGKITNEQYEGLRLGKITTGLGYSNIKGSLETLEKDKGVLARPLPYNAPVQLQRGLYTGDSTTQYILEEREGRKNYTGETLPVHNDTYPIYTNENFSEALLINLEKLEIATKGDSNYLQTSVRNGFNSKNIVSEIANNYGLNPRTTQIVMNPNFAIIYDINNNQLRIGDLLFNTIIDNGKQQMDITNIVAIQIRLALDQISAGKNVELSSDLEENQKEMYEKAQNLSSELDTERGVGYAR